MDFFFKLYYSWLYDKRYQGAEATVLGLSAILTFSVHMIFMYLLSFYFEIKKIPIILIIILFALLQIVIRFYLNRIYIKKERYKSIEFIKYRTLYGIGGALFSIFTLLIFIIGSYLIFEGII